MTVPLEDTQPKIIYAKAPPAARRNRGGCGCFLGALLTGFVVTALVVIGLFLPPVDLYNRVFGLQYAMLDDQNNAVALDGLTLIVDPAAPGTDFGVALRAVSVGDFSAGNAQSASWVPAARASLPPYLALQSSLYQIETTGEAPASTTLSVTIPPTVSNADIVDLYAWDQQTGQWRFVPAQPTASGVLSAAVSEVPAFLGLFQAAPPSPTVLATINITQTLSQQVGQLATIVSPAGMQPTLQGTLAGNPAPGFQLGAGYRIMPVIRNFADPRALDPDTVAAVLANRTVRAEHVRQITTFVTSGSYDGVFIDYRELPAEQRENFSAFIRELSSSLHSVGRLLGVVVPPADNTAGVWDTGAYDWRALGQYADYVQINFDIDPTAFVSGDNRLVEAMLRWAVREISRYKILIRLSALSIREVNGAYTPIGYDEALSALGDVKIEGDISPGGTFEPGEVVTARLDGMTGISGTDTRIQSPFIDYQNDDGVVVSRMWLTTGDALRYRMDRTVAFGLAGVAFDDLLAEGIAESVYPAILNYKLQLPHTTEPGDLALRWRIESADGVLDEVTTALNEELVVTVDAAQGNYAINVVVIAPQAESPRSGAAVAVFAPTFTPTPLPTSTPTPLPTTTPTPVPIVPTATPQPSGGGGSAPLNSGANPNPAPPPAGSIGGFEYGGHVTNAATAAAGLMKSAGMTWMKVQLRYHIGSNPGIAAQAINDAHARGFKILLGIVGDPGELAAGGAAYVRDFANFLGGVAALGPDAIEVWNEPNLDREWPRGQISGTAYADMLRQAYQAIKSANGGVMVISAAPAPTGAEGAFPGQVMNDDRWLREVVNAGGLQYMDCLGAHYNEGIVGPNQTSGDPRDNYYTRYFWGILNTYWQIGQGKQICFTELGYLTPEGFPPLPGFFAWAQNVTLAQQAAWLAEAAALSASSGKVRMMIIWNIDFTVYDSDPQAGYAIIRPGGACPACNALAGAR